MRFTEYLRMAVNNIKGRRLRSWLTMFGIFIGIAAIVALISLGQGLKVSINAQFSGVGVDKITIQNKGSFGPPGGDTVSGAITQSDYDVVEKIRGVDLVTGRLLKSAKVRFRDELKYNYLIGIEPDVSREMFAAADAFTLMKGRDLRDDDGFKAVVGSRVAEGAIFNKPVRVGDKVEIQDQEFEVVGSYEETGLPFFDNVFFTTAETMRGLYSEPEEWNAVIAQVEDVDEIGLVAERVEKELRQHRDVEEGKEDFTVSTPEESLESLNTLINIVQALLVGLALISTVVGAVGITNTMYTAVLERTKEIGVMKAIGAKNSDILNLFLVESGLMGLVGGAVGVVIGIIFAEIISLVAVQLIGSGLFQAYFPWYLIAGSLMFSFITGAAAGFLPARQASRQQPVESLRYE